MTRVEELMLKVAELSPSEKMEFLETVQREIDAEIERNENA